MSSSISAALISSCSLIMKRTIPLYAKNLTSLLLTSKTPSSVSISLNRHKATNTHTITHMVSGLSMSDIPEYPGKAPPEIPSIPTPEPTPIPKEDPVLPIREPPEIDPAVPPEIVPDPDPNPNPKSDGPKPPLSPPGQDMPLPKLPLSPPGQDTPPDVIPPPPPPTGPTIIVKHTTKSK